MRGGEKERELDQEAGCLALAWVTTAYIAPLGKF